MFYRTPHFGEEVYNVNLFKVYIQFRQKEKIYIINLFKVYIINLFYRTGLCSNQMIRNWPHCINSPWIFVSGNFCLTCGLVPTHILYYLHLNQICINEITDIVCIQSVLVVLDSFRKKVPYIAWLPFKSLNTPLQVGEHFCQKRQKPDYIRFEQLGLGFNGVVMIYNISKLPNFAKNLLTKYTTMSQILGNYAPLNPNLGFKHVFSHHLC